MQRPDPILPPGLGAILSALVLISACLFAAALAADEAGVNRQQQAQRAAARAAAVQVADSTATPEH